jgi:hypothetical protein
MKITITDNILDYTVDDYMAEFGITNDDLANVKTSLP